MAFLGDEQTQGGAVLREQWHGRGLAWARG